MEDHLSQMQEALVTQAEVISPKPPPASEQEMRQELARTSAALYNQEDPDKRAELQARIKELQGHLGIDVGKLAGSEMSANAIPDLTVAAKPKKDKPKGKVNLADLQSIVAEQSAKIQKERIHTEIDLPENPEPPTPEQMDAAEKLIQQARVEKMRGNRVQVQTLLEQAAREAPGSPSVLEMIGDDFAERKQLGKALAYYRRAAKLDLKNVNLERKVAMSALGVDASGASANPMTGLDDSAIPMASRRAALILSVFFPGLGHIVAGKTTRGWVTLAVWCACLAWVILMGGDVAKLGAIIAGGASKPNYLVVVPILVMVVTFFWTIADLSGGKEESIRLPSERPRPPVNLPFE